MDDVVTTMTPMKSHTAAESQKARGLRRMSISQLPQAASIMTTSMGGSSLVRRRPSATL